MKRTLKTEAIVLRKRSLPNQDVIVTLLTKELGKINTIAKGIKKITSRRLPHTQTANLINTVIYKKAERFYLQQSNLISGFSEIKKNQEKVRILYIYLFAIERLLPENQVEDLVYKLTRQFLIDLSAMRNSGESILTDYLNSLLTVLGYIKEKKSDLELNKAIEEIIHEKMPELRI